MDILVIAKNIIENNPIVEVSKDIKCAYDSMTPEEKTVFWKNILIAGAKLGATA